MVTLEEIEKELKTIKEQTRANTVKYNTIVYMLNKICKKLEVELRP